MSNTFDYRKLKHHACSYCTATTTFPGKLCFACLLHYHGFAELQLAADHRSLPARDFHRACFTRFAAQLELRSDYMYSLSEKSHNIKEREQLAVSIRNSEIPTNSLSQYRQRNAPTVGITPDEPRQRQLRAQLFHRLLTLCDNKCGACRREIGDAKPYAYDLSHSTALNHSRIPYHARTSFIDATYQIGLGWLLCATCNAIKTEEETRGTAYWRWTRRGIRYFIPTGIPNLDRKPRTPIFYQAKFIPTERAARAKSAENQKPFTDRELFALSALHLRIASVCTHRPSALTMSYHQPARTLWLGCADCTRNRGKLLGIFLEGNTEPTPANNSPTTLA